MELNNVYRLLLHQRDFPLILADLYTDDDYEKSLH